MYKHLNALILKKQESLSQDSFVRKNSFGNIPEHIIADPVKHFESWYPARKQVLNALLGLQLNDGPGFSRPNTELAVQCGVHKSTLDKELRVLRKDELVKTQTGINGNKTYFLNPWFYEPRLKPLLVPIFKSLKFLSYISLVSTLQAVQNNNLQSRARFPYKRVYGYIYTQKYSDIGASLDRVRDTSLITELSLTTQGRIRLSAFPQEALEYANDKLKWATRVKNRFAWFWTCCKNWCKNNEIKPALWRVFKLGGSFAHDVAMVMNDDAAVRCEFQKRVNHEARENYVVEQVKYVQPAVARFQRSEADKARFNEDKARQKAYDAEARANKEALDRLKKRREWLHPDGLI